MRLRISVLVFVLLTVFSLNAFSETASATGEVEEAGKTAPVRVVLETSKGEVVLELFPDKAPGTVENFLTYVRDGHYDGTLFYRVTDFLIQAGSTNPDFTRRKVRDPIQNEADNGLRNELGMVGMARWAPHSATAEFYINTKANPHLDHKEKTETGWGYCIFGRVASGMETVRAIAAVPRGPRKSWQDVPKEEVLIRKVYVAE